MREFLKDKPRRRSPSPPKGKIEPGGDQNTSKKKLKPVWGELGPRVFVEKMRPLGHFWPKGTLYPRKRGTPLPKPPRTRVEP